MNESYFNRILRVLQWWRMGWWHVYWIRKKGYFSQSYIHAFSKRASFITWTVLTGAREFTWGLVKLGFRTFVEVLPNSSLKTNNKHYQWGVGKFPIKIIINRHLYRKVLSKPYHIYIYTWEDRCVCTYWIFFWKKYQWTFSLLRLITHLTLN